VSSKAVEEDWNEAESSRGSSTSKEYSMEVFLIKSIGVDAISRWSMHASAFVVSADDRGVQMTDAHFQMSPPPLC
jgi:hypothetical protein